MNTHVRRLSRRDSSFVGEGRAGTCRRSNTAHAIFSVLSHLLSFRSNFSVSLDTVSPRPVAFRQNNMAHQYRALFPRVCGTKKARMIEYIVACRCLGLTPGVVGPGLCGQICPSVLTGDLYSASKKCGSRCLCRNVSFSVGESMALISATRSSR